ncbi:MAG: putative Fe-S protein [Promethearchaeota archaeon]|nr:MAG: putative Fe-S protein [Candidatus Lokiarchaeota archaeon]
MNIVDEFWILNFDGVPLFHYSPTEEPDYELISSFFSAIQSFAREITGDLKESFIHQISLGNANFIFLANQNYQLYFVSKTPLKIKENQVNSHLKEIETMFLEDFKNDLSTYEGDVTIFEKFKEKFKTYFNNNFIKLKGMW